jgi:hypothetical protein
MRQLREKNTAAIEYSYIVNEMGIWVNQWNNELFVELLGVEL